MRPHFGEHGPNFRAITLQEPPKAQLIPFLQAEHKGEDPLSAPNRLARVDVVLNGSDGNELFELLVDLAADKVIKKEHIKGKHSFADPTYMKSVEIACLGSEKVQEEIKSLDLPEGSHVVVEPWTYATDGMNNMSLRISMVCAP